MGGYTSEGFLMSMAQLIYTCIVEYTACKRQNKVLLCRGKVKVREETKQMWTNTVKRVQSFLIELKLTLFFAVFSR